MKMSSRTWSLAALAAACLAGPGCHTAYKGVNTVEPANPSYVRHNIEDKRIVRDKGTARSVAVLNVIEGTTNDGGLRIGVEVQNQRTKSFRFNYRFDWFDGQGFPYSTPGSTMVSQQIEPGQVLVLTTVAPNPAAKDFRLTLQQSTRDYNPVLPKN
ncbi:MAG: DUF1425 domain-containing protein [Verrucomicrobiales bacterium]|nr:DUF1425 domain-containing protein [Verrucomicrobiales bacterium]